MSPAPRSRQNEAARRGALASVLIALVGLLGLHPIVAAPAGAAPAKVLISSSGALATRTVVAASGRHVYAAWEDWGMFAGVRVIRFAHSADRGEHWFRPGGTGLLAVADGATPVIAAAGDTVHVAWAHTPSLTPTVPGQREIWYRRSDDHGASFGPVEVLDAYEGAAALDSHDPAIAVSDAGAWVAWHDGAGLGVHVAAMQGGNPPVVRHLGHGAHPQIGTGGGGVAVAFATRTASNVPSEVWVATSLDGDQFSPAVNVSQSPAAESSAPDLAFGGGDIHVAWHEGQDEPTVRAASSLDNGASFGAPTTLGPAQGSYPWGIPTIAAAEDLVAVSWNARTADAVLVSSSADRGASFGAPIPIPGHVQGAPMLTAPVITEPGPQAIFDYAMPDRFGADANGDGVVDESLDPSFISPSTWPVELDGCASHSAVPGALSYSWKVDGALVGGNDCKITHAFPSLGEHEVQLTVSQAGGLHDKRIRTIELRDRLVVSIGDSIASGEGTPAKPLPGLVWNDQQCDRSSLGGPAQAALKLERADRHSSVTFVHLACSGATIRDPDIAHGGLLTPYQGINPGAPLAPQVDQAAALIGLRDIDALLVSIGANDARFSDVVKACIATPHCDWNPFVVNDFDDRVAGLPASYAALATALDPMVDPSHVYVTEYPDPTIPEWGGWDLSCVLDGQVPGGSVTAGEARWASEHLVPALNGSVAAATAAHGWNFVGGISSAFAGHGYCAADHWIVQIGESHDRQGDANGPFHPNATGHQISASRLAAEVGADWLAEPAGPPPPASVNDPLGDLYLAWSNGPKLMVTALSQSGGGVTPLTTTEQSVPNNDLGAGFFAIAATEEGAWTGWTEQTNGPNPSDMGGIRAFVGTAFQAPPNLTAERVALIQGPSDPDFLVADRTTAIEATIDSRFAAPLTANVSYSITEVPGGAVAATGTQPVSFTPGENVVLITPDPGFTPDDSTSYRAVVTVDPGGAVVEADEDDNVIDSEVKPTAASRVLKVVYVPFSGVSCTEVIGVEKRSRDFLRGVLPVPDGSLISATDCAMSASAPATSAGVVGGLQQLGSLAKLAGVDVVVGVAPAGWVSTGQGGGAVGVAIVAGSGSADPPSAAAIVEQGYSGDVVAHEILHTYGRVHTPNVPAPGFWVARRARVQGTDLMHPSTVPTPWISSDTYEFLRNRLEHTVGDPTVILVRGTIDPAGVLTAGAWYREDGVLDAPFGAGGALTLEYRDAGGNVLATTGFDAGAPDGVGAAGAVTGDRAFSVRVPDAPTGTTDLVLLDGTDVLLSREVSEHPPTNEVTAPTAGAVFGVGQTVDVDILSDDVDGDPLVHAVLVSIDDGATWRPLALDVAGDTFSFVARPDLVSDKVRVRVLTTDGVRTAIDDSPAFEIGQDVAVGNRIVYVRHHVEMTTSDEGLWMMDPDGANQVEVPLPLSGAGPQASPHHYEPDWAPDGSRIVFSSQLVEDSPGDYRFEQFSQGDLWSVRPGGNDLTLLTPTGDLDSFRCPAFSPDGTKIAAYARIVSPTFPFGLVEAIAVMDQDGSDLHRVIDFPAGVTTAGQNTEEDSGTCPVWSPDGTRLAFSAHEDFVGPHTYVVDADGSDFGVLWSGPPPPFLDSYLKGLDWSSAGEVLVTVWIVDQGVQRTDLWAIPTDGAAPHVRASLDATVMMHTQRTPDGTRVYGTRLASAPTYTATIAELHTYELDGSDHQVLRAPANAYDYLWPDWIDTGGGPTPPPPAASAGGPYAATEDLELQLDAGASTLAEGQVPLAEWDVDGDGAFDDALGLAPLVTFPHAGPVGVRVRITPANGAAVISDPVAIDVAPAAPSVLVVPPAPAGPGTPVTVQAAFVDAGTEPHTATVNWGDGTGAQLVTITPTSEGGTITAPHSYGSIGPYTVTVEVCDAPGPCAHDEIDVAVLASVPANLPPTGANAAAMTAVGTAVFVPLPATDPEGVALTVSALGAPAHGSVGPAPGENGPGVVYTPAAGFVGTDSFTYVVSDGRQLSAAATVTVTVGNLAPVAGHDQVTGAYGDPTEVAVADLLLNDVDPDATGPLTIGGVYETLATHGTIELVGSTITYTPDPGFAGTATFDYAATDGQAIGIASVDVLIEPPADLPGAPLDAAAIGGDGSAHVVWSAPASDGGSPITGYEVRLVGTATVVAVAGAVREVTVTGLVNGTDHRFEVRATNATGFGPWSAPSNVARPRAACAVGAFSDVPDAHPFCPEISWMAAHGIAQGYPDGTYRPTAAVTRQAMAAFLYRMAGAPRGADPGCDAAPFPDVPLTHTFCGEIDWLADEGITTGFTDGTFRPTASISRQAMAAFLYRLAGATRGDEPTCAAARFTDVGVDHPFCGEIDWMADNGVTGGFDDGTFRPVTPVSRQAMAAYLFRYDVLTGIVG